MLVVANKIADKKIISFKLILLVYICKKIYNQL